MVIGDKVPGGPKGRRGGGQEKMEGAGSGRKSVGYVDNAETGGVETLQMGKGLMEGVEEKIREMVTGDKAPGGGGASLIRLQIHRGDVEGENTMQVWIGMGDVAAPQPDEGAEPPMLNCGLQVAAKMLMINEEGMHIKWEGLLDDCMVAIESGRTYRGGTRVAINEFQAAWGAMRKLIREGDTALAVQVREVVMGSWALTLVRAMACTGYTTKPIAAGTQANGEL